MEKVKIYKEAFLKGEYEKASFLLYEICKELNSKELDKFINFISENVSKLLEVSESSEVQKNVLNCIKIMREMGIEKKEKICSELKELMKGLDTTEKLNLLESRWRLLGDELKLMEYCSLNIPLKDMISVAY